MPFITTLWNWNMPSTRKRIHVPTGFWVWSGEWRNWSMNLKSTDIRSWFKGNGWNDKKPVLSRENQTFILTQHRICPSDIKELVFYKSSPWILDSCCITSSFQTIYRWRWWITVNHEKFHLDHSDFLCEFRIGRRALFFWRRIFQDLPEKWYIWFFIVLMM